MSPITTWRKKDRERQSGEKEQEEERYVGKSDTDRGKRGRKRRGEKREQVRGEERARKSGRQSEF